MRVYWDNYTGVAQYDPNSTASGSVWGNYWVSISGVVDRAITLTVKQEREYLALEWERWTRTFRKPGKLIVEDVNRKGSIVMRKLIPMKPKGRSK